MKIAVAGKGGAGKTTIAGALARVLAADGHQLLAIDSDPNPNLGISLGLGVENTTSLAGAREALAANGGVLPTAMEEVVQQFATDAGERIRLLQIWKLDYLKPT